jgi:hypothetical protein
MFRITRHLLGRTPLRIASLSTVLLLATHISGQNFARPDGSIPLPVDWSASHVVYTVDFKPEQAAHMINEPRLWASWFLHGNSPRSLLSSSATALQRSATSGDKKDPKPPKLTRDWSVSLGAGGVAQDMSPAKYTFDVNANASCTADFAVYPISVSTSYTRAHVVGTFSTSTQSTGSGSVTITVTPTGGSGTTLTLNASTSSNTGTNFEVFTSGSISTNATNEAVNLAAAINRNLSNTALARVVARESTNTVTVYTLTPGARVVITDTETLNNFSFATVTVGANGSQANIVGFNNLYSGSAIGINQCSGSFPAFTFSYASGASAVTNSPVISLDGTKVAYVESDATIGAILHVLTIGTGTEVGTCTVGGGSGTPNCATHPVVPGSTASSKATDFMLPLGLSLSTPNSNTDTYSSLFVNYANDTAYVGDDGGILYQITTIFTGTPTLASSVTVHSAFNLSAPVVDVANTGNIFVGDSDGILYNYNTSLVQQGTITIGSATTKGGGIRDAPIVDSTNSVGYVIVGCNSNSGNSGDTQLNQFGFTSTSLTSKQSVTFGSNSCNSTPKVMYAPAPDNNYYTQGISSSTPGSNGELITCTGNGSTTLLSQFQFTSGTMSATAQFADDNPDTSNGDTCSPLTEFYNPNSTFSGSFNTLTRSGTTVTVNTLNPDGFRTGDSVTIAGVTGSGANTNCGTSQINTTATITVASATEFTYISSGSGTLNCTVTSATATGAVDYLFFGLSAGNAQSFAAPLTNATQTAMVIFNAPESEGTSGIIVDNVGNVASGGSGQTASIYFGLLVENTAVKLTQNGLQ